MSRNDFVSPGKVWFCVVLKHLTVPGVFMVFESMHPDDLEPGELEPGEDIPTLIRRWFKDADDEEIASGECTELSCDCKRSELIRDSFREDFPSMPCGHTINCMALFAFPYTIDLLADGDTFVPTQEVLQDVPVHINN